MKRIYSGTVSRCKNTQPHPPHKKGEYVTVCHGRLDEVCPGVGHSHLIEVVRRGDAYTPSRIAISEEE